MKPTRIAVVLVVLAAVVVVLRLNAHREMQGWRIDTKAPTPIYETDSYPYGSQSHLNPVVGYLNPGDRPKIIGMSYGKEWRVWEVSLPSGKSGFIFDPDVEVRREG